MESRLNLSKEKTDENDEEQHDSRIESIDPRHMNMQQDRNAENLPLTDFSNQNATPLPAFGSAFPRFAFSSLRQENLFHVSDSGPSADDQARISDAQFEEAASLSSTSGNRQIALGLESNEIAPDSTNGNVPDYIEVESLSLYQQNDGEISAAFRHEAADSVYYPDILLNNETFLPQSLQQNNMEPILYHTRTNAENLDGNFCRVNSQYTDLLPEQNTTIDDPIVYHDDTEYNSDQAVDVSYCMEDYDPQEGPSTMNTSVSTEKHNGLFPQKEFCKSVGFDGVLNQHSLYGDDKIDDTSQTDADLVGPDEDASIMNMQAQLNSPLLIRTVEKPHECKICHKQFSRKYHLEIHFRIHTGEKPYECKICHKRYTQQVTLDGHIRMHLRETPYACQTCGKIFTEKGSLGRHIRTHLGEKPHKCETCGKNFSQKWNLKSHIRSHKGEKAYACETCGKRFTRKDTLSNHSKKHTSEDNFKCEICGEFCFDIDSLNRHKRTHHEK